MTKVLEPKDPCFKQLATLKLGLPCSSYGISHKYQIICLALGGQLHLIHTEDIINENAKDLRKTKVPCQTLVCNEEIVVVGYTDNIIIYSYSALLQETPKPLTTIKTKSNVKKLLFNPTDYTMLAILSDDGNLLLTKINMTGAGFQNWALNDSKVVSMCFSPKGKQLCVGHESGDLTQLKLDLTVAKKIKGPGGIPLSLLWVSTTQFLALVLSNQQDIGLVQIDVHKAPAPPTYVDFGDVFVSDVMDSSSQSWFNVINDTIICSSSTSSDIVVLVKSDKGWSIADIEDRRRAALPLDNFAVGGVLYFNYQKNVSFNESEVYGPMPVYVIGSQDGILSSFSFVNKGGMGENVHLLEGLTSLNWTNLIENTSTVAPQIQQTPSETASFLQPGQQRQPSTFPAFSFSSETSKGFPNKQPPQDSQLFSLLSTPQSTTSFMTPQAQGSSLFSQQSPASGDSTKTNLKLTQPTQPPLSFTGVGTKTEAPIAQVQAEISKLPIREDLADMKRAVEKKEISETLLKRFEEFEKRMENHRKICRAHNEKFKAEEAELANEIEEKILSKVSELEDFVDKTEKACKIQKSEAEFLKESTLSQLSQLTYAQSLEDRNRDPKYLRLMKARPMDPATVKRLRELEKKVKYIKSQMQECRRHFFFSNCPPLTPQAVSKLIFKTIDDHESVIKSLRSECNSLREKLKLNTSSSVDELTTELKKTSLNDNSKWLVDTEALDELKTFLRKKNVVKIRTFGNADYNLSNGILTNREGIKEGIDIKSTSTIADPIPESTVSSVKTMSNTSTQTDSIANEFRKIELTEDNKLEERKPESSNLTDQTLGFKSFGITAESSTFTSKPNVAKEPDLIMGKTAAPVASSSINTSERPQVPLKPFSVPFQPFSSTESKLFPSSGPLFSFKPTLDQAASSTVSDDPFSAAPFSFKPDSGTKNLEKNIEEINNRGQSDVLITPASEVLSSKSSVDTGVSVNIPKMITPVFTVPNPPSAASVTERSPKAVSSPSSQITNTPLSGTSSFLSGSSLFSKPISAESVVSTGGLPSFTFKFSDSPTSSTPGEAAVSAAESKPFGGGIFSLPRLSTPATVQSVAPTSKIDVQSFSFGDAFSKAIEPATPTSEASSLLGPSATTTPASSTITSVPEIKSPVQFASLASTTIEPKPFGEMPSLTPFSFRPSAPVTTTTTTSEESKPFGEAIPSTGIKPFSFNATSSTTATTTEFKPFGETIPSTGVTPFSFKPTTPSTSASAASQPFGENIASTPFTFNPSAPATSTGGGLFGSNVFSSSTTPGSSIFGSSASSFGQPSAGFGQLSNQPTSGSTFGSVSTTLEPQKSIFGGPSMFGSSPFGSPTPAATDTTTAGSIFGQPSTFGQQPTAAFGVTNTLESPQKPTFGGPPVFGGSPFGSPTAFSTTASSPSSSSIFGAGVEPASFGQFAQQPASQASAFGGGSVFGSSFGSTSPFSSGVSSSGTGSIFGGGTTEVSSFGQFAQQQPTSAFGTAPEQQQQKPLSFGGSSFSSWR